MSFETMSSKDKKPLNYERSTLIFLSSCPINSQSAVNSALFHKYALYTGTPLNYPQLLLIWNENLKNGSLKEEGIENCGSPVSELQIFIIFISSYKT